ncbi:MULTISPECIES: DUF302 domain-containing protein [Bacillaceae]|uniref:DUF302 domain-containing protein n=1 Tax=Evansella alkalicola TaxID=745819 RepID=A0ABS6JVJ0_9BACI|nr:MULTISPECIES: DUF302 domain-containing protein [Bacillaceae]MBU9722597.1 DUF302 domain-containing protein [Bacillus alkalicola]
MFHYTVETTMDMPKAIENLEASLKEEGFGVLWDFDLKGKLEEKGLEYDSETRILEVCNPHEAKRVLEMNKLAGYFLPCKIVVFSDDEGRTKIGMPKPTALIEAVKDDKLMEIAEDIEKRLIHCIDKIVK